MESGIHTAGTAPQVTDGATGVVIASGDARHHAEGTDPGDAQAAGAHGPGLGIEEFDAYEAWQLECKPVFERV